jgi:predicted site-specific integrase-resolvase
VVQPNWLTTAQAGRRLGVDPTVVIKWVKVGRLRGRRDADRWRVDPASVEEESKRISRAS